MKQNRSTTPAASSSARDCLDAARAANAALREEYDTPPTCRKPDHGVRVAALHQAINFGLKAAEVEALIAIGEALAPVRDRLTYSVPETTNLARRLEAARRGMEATERLG